MKYINIVQRFIPLQFGEVYKESDLLEGFKDCLEKINTDGMMVLNDFSLFQAYFNDGIRSQRSNYNFIYIFIHLQFAGFVIYFVSASTNRSDGRKRPDSMAGFRRAIAPADATTLPCNHATSHVNEKRAAAKH